MAMKTETITVQGMDYKVELLQLQREFWRATGLVRGGRVSRTGRNGYQALRNWITTVEQQRAA
jgi:hypothetical protein